MIDTLKLGIEDWSNTDGSLFTIQRGPLHRIDTDGSTREQYDGESLLMWTGTGKDQRDYTGRKAYFTDPDKRFVIDIGHFNGKRWSTIQFSIPKIAGSGNNISPTSIEETCRVIDWLESDIREKAGYRFNIYSALLKRVDLFKNITTDYDLPVYMDLFNKLKVRRGKVTDYGDTGYLVGNTQWQVAMYDKCAEMKNRGMDTTMIDPRTFRVESRLLDGRKINQTLGMTTLSDAIDNPDTLESYYIQSLRDHVFKTPPTSATTFDVDLMSEIIGLAVKPGKHFVQHFLRYYALLTLPTDPTSIALLESMLTDAVEEQSPGTRNRSVPDLMNEFREVQAMREKQVVVGSEGLTLGDLYMELEMKLTGEVIGSEP